MPTISGECCQEIRGRCLNASPFLPLFDIASAVTDAGHSAYIGFDNGGVPSAPRNAEYEVLFNDIVIVSRRAQCSGGCPILPTNGNVYAGFDFDTGTLPAQAQITTGLLKINVYHPGYTGGQFQNFIVDVVNLKVAA